ncbi:MAG: nucleotidyltransferase family protein [Firmicutes bacterium]|nr:nucleotidyltransferase family protein [Bacillota bacterium]
MKKVAVICEYNPFHNGHKSQLELIKKTFGADTAVIALMSGNFVQRGEPAVIPKYERAEVAVKCGADLVLELPFPWSCSGAEHFASCAVRIASGLGAVDALCFGSSTGELIKYEKCAENILSDKFLKAYSEKKRNTCSSEIRLREEVYASTFGEGYPVLPNDILAVEYIKAVKRIDSKISLFTHKREPDFSATKARQAFAAGDYERLAELVPEESYNLCLKYGSPAKLENIGSAILAALRLGSYEKAAECAGEAGRMYDAAWTSADIQGYFEECSAKHLTDARIRRMTLNAAVGVSYDDVGRFPGYTTLLAANKTGCEILSEIRRTSSVKILTKPADYKHLPEESRNCFETALKAEGLYALSVPAPYSPDTALRMRPFIVK